MIIILSRDIRLEETKTKVNETTFKWCDIVQHAQGLLRGKVRRTTKRHLTLLKGGQIV